MNVRFHHLQIDVPDVDFGLLYAVMKPKRIKQEKWQ